MKKLYLLLIVFISFGIIDVNANWYGAHWENKTIGDGTTWCSGDGDTAGGMYSFSHGSYDVRVTGESGNNMRCEYWDAANPTISSSASTTTYNSSGRYGISNNPVISINTSDTGGSGVASYNYRWNGGGWQSGSSTNIPGEGVHTLGMRVSDVATNNGSSSATYKLDLTEPTSNTPTYLDGWSRTDQTISYSAGDGGGSTLYEVRLERRSAPISDSGTQLGWLGWSAIPGETISGINSNTFSKTYTEPATSNIAYQYRVVSIDNAGNETTGTEGGVLKMDNTSPSGEIEYSNDWESTDQEISYKVVDNGGSLIKQVVLQRREATVYDDGDLSSLSWSAWVSIPGETHNNVLLHEESFTYNEPKTNNKAYQYRVYAVDNIGNELAYLINSNELKMDNKKPKASDINTITSIILEATNIQEFNIGVETGLGNTTTRGGAPIVEIRGQLENFGSCTNSFLGEDTTNNSNTFTHDKNISEVKIGCDFNSTKGGRIYTYKITYVRDAAGNITSNPSGVQSFDYEVYADSGSATGVIPIAQVDDLGDDNNIARGDVYPITISLRDGYGNEVIPAPGATRIIDFNFDVNNTLGLIQYPSGTTDGVENNTPKLGYSDYLSSSNSFYDESSSDGDYTFNFKVYSPTSDAYSGAIGDFQINDIEFDINGVPNTPNDFSNTITNSTIDFKFKPLYYLDITGDLDPDGDGFVEGETQTGALQIIKNGSVSTTIDRLYFRKVGSSQGSFTGTGQVASSGKKSIDNTLGSSFLNSLSPNTHLLSILFHLTDMSANVDDIVNVSVVPYIEYVINRGDGDKQVRYQASQILNDKNNNNFNALKIQGLSNIAKYKQRDLITDQDEKDIQNLNGNITKASLKRDVRKAALSTVKFVEIDPLSSPSITNINWGGDDGNDENGKELGDILYYGGLGGGNVILETSNTNSGKKTIVVVGGNLYIKSNIVNSLDSDILGIIVLEDESGNGGKLYIDPDVSRLDAVIYTDKSVISYDEYYNNGDTSSITQGEIDGNVLNSMMTNQLYIYGSVFSENTIGGSRIQPDPICPFWTGLEGSSCTTTIAQRYDLNYLRAGFETKYDPSYPDYPVVIKYNSNLQSSPPPLFSK